MLVASNLYTRQCLWNHLQRNKLRKTNAVLPWQTLICFVESCSPLWSLQFPYGFEPQFKKKLMNGFVMSLSFAALLTLHDRGAIEFRAFSTERWESLQLFVHSRPVPIDHTELLPGYIHIVLQVLLHVVQIFSYPPTVIAILTSPQGNMSPVGESYESLLPRCGSYAARMNSHHH